MIHVFIFFVMVCMLIVQLGCVVYMVCKRKNMFEVLYGFGLWGSIPINLLNILSKQL